MLHHATDVVLPIDQGTRGTACLVADARRARPVALDVHRSELAECRRCAAELPPGALPVLAEARAPRAMLIGQAPGPTEATLRRPFQGRAGKTLFRWLAIAGLSEAEAREFFYIAAITRCYPGAHPGGRGDRVPTPGERARCAPWLEAELALIRPPLIVTLGRLAVDRFLAPAPLAELVGTVHEAVAGTQRAAVLPLPHPSGASSWLNAPAHRALLDQALVQLREWIAVRRAPATRAAGGAPAGGTLAGTPILARGWAQSAPRSRHRATIHEAAHQVPRRGPADPGLVRRAHGQLHQRDRPVLPDAR